ncbi:lysine--tRNA ligase [Aquipuribacter sp. MA13-6]|uniref:lysine--tRNA ligase n=1 Tax=unclassified Aquipuribacter TaxID=2635084 RepID=UPI003EE888D7
MSDTTAPAAAPDLAGPADPVDPVPADDRPDEQMDEQMAVRAAKRERILAAGGQAYPVLVPRTHSLAQVRSSPGWQALEDGQETQDVVSVTGRVMFARGTGKLAFATLQEGDERLQVMLSLAEVGPELLDAWKHDVDLGDQVSVTGRVVSSRRGELSVMATTWQLASKALRPLPNHYDGAQLAEDTRARRRYVDLVVRPEAREVVRTKATVLRSLRETFHRLGYLEVETPVLQLVHGGATARPFHTHLNALDVEMSLRIATELYLKRCVVGGLEKVYEIGRTFRNEGIDSTHSPEFTMLEAYEAYGSYDTMAALVRELVLDAATAAGRTVVPDGHGGEVDLRADWRTVTVHDAVSGALGEAVDVDTDVTELRRHAERAGVELRPGAGAGEVVLELFEKLVEHTLLQPTFVRDYPAEVRPLARPHRDDPRLAEAWDLIVAGAELSPAYSELADPVLQRERLVQQSLLAADGDPEAMQLDEDFLRALEHGMPPTGGIGLGVDRLVMLLTGVGIRETILFPLLRPEG